MMGHSTRASGASRCWPSGSCTGHACTRRPMRAIPNSRRRSQTGSVCMRNCVLQWARAVEGAADHVGIGARGAPLFLRAVFSEARPDGYLAAWRWLAAAQVPLGSLRYRYPRLGDAALSGVSEGNVLIMTLPQRLPFQTAEWESLDEWVGRGNTLVVLAGLDDTSRWMEPDADPQLALQRISHIRFTAEKAEDDWGLRDLLEPRRIEFVPRGEHPLLNGVQSMYAVSDLPAGRWRAHSTDNSMPLAIARRSDANQSVLWLKAAGRGQIIVCAFATPFSNRAIGQADNAQLLSNIIAWTRAPSGSVIFDDAHQGLVDFYDASAFFGDPRLHRTLLWLLLLWLVFVLVSQRLRSAPHRGRAIDEMALIEASGSSFTVAVDQDDARRALFANFFNLMRRGIGWREDGEPVWDWLDAQAGISAEQRVELHQLYARVRVLQGLKRRRLHNFLSDHTRA